MIKSSLFLDLVKEMLPGKKKHQNKFSQKKSQPSPHLLNLLSEPNCKVLLKDFQDSSELIKNIQLQKVRSTSEFNESKDVNELNICSLDHAKYFVQQIYKRRRPTHEEYLKLKQLLDLLKEIQKKQSKIQGQENKMNKTFLQNNFQCSQEQKKRFQFQLQNVIATYQQFIKSRSEQQCNKNNKKNYKKLSLVQELREIESLFIKKQQIFKQNSQIGKENTSLHKNPRQNQFYNSPFDIKAYNFDYSISKWLFKLKIQLNKKYKQTQEYFEICLEDQQLPWLNAQCFCSFVKEITNVQNQKQVEFALQLFHQIVFCQAIKADNNLQENVQQIFQYTSDIKLKQYSSKVQILDQYLSLISRLIQSQNYSSSVNINANEIDYSKLATKILYFFVDIFVPKTLKTYNNRQSTQQDKAYLRDSNVDSLISWVFQSYTLSNQVKKIIIKALLQKQNTSSTILDQKFIQFVIKGYFQYVTDVNFQKYSKFQLEYQLFIIAKQYQKDNLQTKESSLSYVQVQKIAEKLSQNYLRSFLLQNKQQNQIFNKVQDIVNKNKFQNQKQLTFHMIIVQNLFYFILQKLKQQKITESNQNKSSQVKNQQLQQIYELICQKQMNLLQQLTQNMKQAHQNLQSAYLSKQNFINAINVLCQAQIFAKHIMNEQLDSISLTLSNHQDNLKKFISKIRFQYDKFLQFYHPNKKLRQQNCSKLIILCLKQKVKQQKLKVLLNYMPKNFFCNFNFKNKILLNHKLTRLFSISSNEEKNQSIQRLTKLCEQSQPNLSYFKELLALSNSIRNQLKHTINLQKVQLYKSGSVIFQIFNIEWQNCFNRYSLMIKCLNEVYHIYTNKKQELILCQNYKSNQKTQTFKEEDANDFNFKLYRQLSQGKLLLNQIQIFLYKQINPIIKNSITPAQEMFYKTKLLIQMLIKTLHTNQKLYDNEEQKTPILSIEEFLKDFVKISKSQQFNIIQNIQNHQLSIQNQSQSQKLSNQNFTLQQFIYKKYCILKQLRDLWLTKNNDEIIQNILTFNIKKIQFFSSTFNGQLLIFGSIYNPKDQVYFFQNHFQQHITLQIYSILLNLLIEQQNSLKIFEIFQRLRTQIGILIESTVYLPQSHHFYIILNVLKYSCLTFTHKFLAFIDISELSIFFNLLLQFIKRDNHPLLRQYIQIMLGRVYLSIGRRNEQKRRQMRNKMINMLYIELNTGVPILLLIGYELIDYTTKKIQLQKQEILLNKNLISQKNLYQKHDIQDEYGSLEIKNKHQMDIHFILVKFISCHTAYLRAICQYYLSKYLELQPQPDQLLVNLSKFWKEDKDSSKIIYNISLAVEGYKKALQQKDDAKYLGFQRVEQYPSERIKYELNSEAIWFFKFITQYQARPSLSLLQKKLIKNRIKQLQEDNLLYIKETVHKIQEAKSPKQQIKPPATSLKKHVKDKIKNKKNQQKNTTKNVNVEIKQNSLLCQVPNQIIKKALRSQTQAIFRSHLIRQSLKLNSCPKPKIIIIATLLQKVHNFGYLMRTLTSHSAMLTVPSKQPLLHPECQELIPKDMDVQVIQIKKQQLRDFIMLQKLNGYPLIALEQCSKSISLQKMNFPQKYMLLLGNQRIGAPGTLLNLADILVQIPQVGKIRSLNVHVSMVICFWEYLKQSKTNENLKGQKKKN